MSGAESVQSSPEAMTVVSDRFHAAAGQAPLDVLSNAARHELAAVLERAETFEDLPGKWQAALLESEQGATRPRGSCCGGAGRATAQPAG